MDILSKTLPTLMPSDQTMRETADTAATVVCTIQALKRAKWALGGIVVFIIVYRWYSQSENFDDIEGIVEDVSDSHILENVIVADVRADRVNYPAVPVAGTAKTTCEHREQKQKNGTVKHSTHCSCVGPSLEYTDETGETQRFACGGRSGQCPTGNGYVTKYPDGRRICVFRTPKVKCHINGSVAACEHAVSCPNIGDSVQMARSLSDKSLTCLQGNWNRCKLNVSYYTPQGQERTQTFTIPMDSSGSEKFKKGQTIPVYYSNKNRKIYLTDSNMQGHLGWVVLAVALFVIYKTLDAASFLSRPVCGLRLGLRVADKLDDQLGLDLI
jgi:hypothetical protein